MKKVLVLALCISLVFISFGHTFANNIKEIDGLQEKFDAIWLSNTSHVEVVVKMKSTRDAYVEDEMVRVLKAPDYMKRKIGLSGTIEEQQQKFRDSLKLDYTKGILVREILNKQYLDVYATNNCFDYLFGDMYWAVPLASETAFAYFKYDGEYLNHSVGNNVKINFAIHAKPIMDLLCDKAKISALLAEINESKVDEIQIITMAHYYSFIYIQCEEREYVTRLIADVPPSEKAKSEYLEVNKFYNAREYIDKMVKNINTIFATPKSTFETEAKSLQQAGLLNGNEKGLDLLKPLTRIEATTLLVRALGLENEPTEITSKFIDIPNGNWGVKYANIAADQGLTKGVGEGKFAPDALVTDNQFATMLLRSVEASEFNWQTAIQILIERDIITQEQAKTMDLFTRGDMAKIIYEARENGLLKKR